MQSFIPQCSVMNIDFVSGGIMAVPVWELVVILS